ncbi:hypothetical protein RchiOBHm_Chr5g0060391 [Rosa chinensis]|uniref:Uncharacterized protein n=2 Tax=Rosa chinensis TaxID=74649 RepID=A0A2P6QHM3_ROSCH|nr:hypothetical protein RchiOBHm_Chr5g0060391 [Rosa chinensis]
MSGARLLYKRADFIGFIRAIKSMNKLSRIMQNNSSSISLLAEDGSCKIDSSILLKEHLSSLPSDLKCYEGHAGYAGRNYYVIKGKVVHPQTSSLLGEILQKYSGQHSVFYTEIFPQYGIPEWFFSVNGSSAAFPLNPMNGWKGIAACAVFTVLDNLDPEKPDIGFELKIGGRNISGPITESLTSLKVGGFMGMFYGSRGSLSHLMSSDCTSTIKVRFYSKSKNITVQSCGYQIVFHENMEEFMETILQCSVASQTSQLSKDTSREEPPKEKGNSLYPNRKGEKIQVEKKHRKKRRTLSTRLLKSPCRSICCFLCK